MFDRLLCFFDDLIIKIDLLTFRVNQKIKAIEERHSK